MSGECTGCGAANCVCYEKYVEPSMSLTFKIVESLQKYDPKIAYNSLLTAWGIVAKVRSCTPKQLKEDFSKMLVGYKEMVKK